MTSGVALTRGLIHIDAFLAQQQRPRPRMALLTRNDKWRETMIIGLIHIDAFLAQQQRHDIGMAILTRNDKWRRTIIELIHIDALPSSKDTDIGMAILTRMKVGVHHYSWPDSHRRLPCPAAKHDIGMAILARNDQWRRTIIIGLIHIDAFLAQQQRHDLGMAHLTRNTKWRGTIILGPIPIAAFLAQQR